MATEGGRNRQNQRKRKREAIRGSLCASGQDSLPLPRLPIELIIEILTRLPVKSLLRFRSVCKSWRSFISSTQFVKEHLSLLSKDTDFTHHNLILTSTSPQFDLQICSLYSVLNKNFANATVLDYPLKSPVSSVWVVGTCNGLVCIAIEEDTVFLWNPTTRISRRLPELGMQLKNGCFVLYGFGYDACNDDYKVVGIFCVFRDDGVHEAEVRVFSIKSQSWKRIDDFSFGIPLDDSGKFVNGALHWSSTHGMELNTWVIVYLDLAKETYGKIGQPNYGDGDFDLTLGVVRDCLCVLCNYSGIRADLWVMKKYGEENSWIRMAVIPYFGEPERSQYSPPLCITKDGDILFEFGPRLLCYNSKNNRFKYPVVNSFNLLESDTYIETLVSPMMPTANLEGERQQN